MSDMNSFGPQMKARREALGLTLREVAAICNGELSNAYISQLESGKIKKPSAHVVLLLCSAYGISTNDALAWLGRPTDIPPPKLCGECGRALPPSFVIDGGETA